MSETPSSEYSPLEKILVAGGALGLGLTAATVGAPYGALATGGAALLGVAGGAIGGKIAYDIGDYLIQRVQSPEATAGGLLGAGAAYFGTAALMSTMAVTAPYSLLYAVPAAMLGFSVGSGVGDAVKSYGEKAGNAIVGTADFVDRAFTSTYKGVTDSIGALVNGLTGRVGDVANWAKRIDDHYLSGGIGRGVQALERNAKRYGTAGLKWAGREAKSTVVNAGRGISNLYHNTKDYLGRNIGGGAHWARNEGIPAIGRSVRNAVTGAGRGVANWYHNRGSYVPGGATPRPAHP